MGGDFLPSLSVSQLLGWGLPQSWGLQWSPPRPGQHGAVRSSPRSSLAAGESLSFEVLPLVTSSKNSNTIARR